MLAVTVVKRSDKASGFTILPRRWGVERTFGWISFCVTEEHGLSDPGRRSPTI